MLDGALPAPVAGSRVHGRIELRAGGAVVNAAWDLAAKREGETVQAAFSGLPPNVTGGEVLFEAPRSVSA